MFHSEENGSKGMDPLVLIDAIAICMAYEEKELCKIGEVALAVIFDVASIILGSKERVRLWAGQALLVSSPRRVKASLLMVSYCSRRPASCHCSPTLLSGSVPAATSRLGMPSWVVWCPSSSSWRGCHSSGSYRTS